MRDLHFYLILFLFLLNFIFLITLSNFVVRLADGIKKTIDSDVNYRENRGSPREDRGLVDV